MAFEIQRCDALYHEALHGIQYLPKESRKAIYLSAKLYQQILRRIEKLDYNVFEHSARTRKSEKFMVIMQHMGKRM
jgi:phytoene/squalene synthetase